MVLPNSTAIPHYIPSFCLKEATSASRKTLLSDPNYDEFGLKLNIHQCEIKDY
jgi:hypothetical protein